MPITASAKKALRQSEARRARNKTKRESAKRIVKDYRRSLAAKKFDEAKRQLATAYAALDKLAKAGVIKKNAAARTKSRLAQAMARASKASS